MVTKTDPSRFWFYLQSSISNYVLTSANPLDLGVTFPCSSCKLITGRNQRDSVSTDTRATTNMSRTDLMLKDVWVRVPNTGRVPSVSLSKDTRKLRLHEILPVGWTMKNIRQTPADRQWTLSVFSFWQAVQTKWLVTEDSLISLSLLLSEHSLHVFLPECFCNVTHILDSSLCHWWIVL